MQFGDKTAGGQPGGSGHCADCEAMLTDALDGTLSAADQELFNLHMADCGPCGQLLADAKRGAAWLEMLRNPAPEPPAALLERILAQTNGEAARAVLAGIEQYPGAAVAHPQQGVPALAAGYAIGGAAGAYGNPFPRRAVAAFRTSWFGQIMQPRLIMTAAMAFFSIALTMNLTGFHPTSLRASDLQPSSLKRDFFAADARVVQYYEGLRVVYELESRVHDLQSGNDNDAAAGVPGAPPAAPASQAPAVQPGAGDQRNQKTAPQPGSKQPEHGKPAQNPGTSRREEPNPIRRLTVSETWHGRKFGSTMEALPGRKLV